MFRKLIREPLAHFLFLGLLLFLLFNRVSGGRGGAEHRIVVNEATVATIVQRYQSVWQRPPTPAELRGLVDTHVREEILYREGVAMGLDRDDSVIRRRVLQKLDVLSEESAGEAAPGDADLETWLQKNAARYAQPAVLDFEQVMFDPVRHRDSLQSDVATALVHLRAGADPGTIGDASLLPERNAASPADLVVRDFGDEFARSLLALPVGDWQGPVTTGYGVHLVRVTRRTPGRPAALAEVRPAVERDWESDRRVRAKEDYYRKLREGYDVVIEAGQPAGARAEPGN